MRLLLVSVLIASTTLAGVSAISAREAPASPQAAQSESFGTFGFDESGMDKSVKPGDDFYSFANGTWAKNTPIPDDKPNYSMFGMLDDLSKQRIRGILETASKDPESKIGRMYASYLDTAKVDALGLAPIRPWLDKVKTLNDRGSYSGLVVEAQRMGIRAPYVGYAFQDDKQPDRYLFVLRQDGTGMPDRDMYLSNSAKLAAVRTAYEAHLARMLTLAGEANAEARARAVMALETDIAKVHWNREDSSDSEKIYNKFSVAQTAQFSSPTLDLPTVLRTTGANIDSVQVAQPSALKGIADLLQNTPLEVLKDQLLIRSLEDLSGALPKAFRDQQFAFYDKVMKGTPEQEPRWRRAVKFTEAALVDDVGKEYASRYFPPEYKVELNKLVGNITAVMADRIEKLDWMRPETKVRALNKLRGFTVKVGYPDKWRSSEGLEVIAGDLFGNMVRASRFNYAYMIDKVGKPADKGEFLMPPQTINAYANYSWKEIVFPAGILQPPFFDPKADPAINYGGIGAVIGHEIVHHFDDQGAKYDENGVLNNWWTPQDLAAFQASGKAMSAQAETYEVLPGEFVKGEFTLGENIGDLAGLTLAHDAYRRSLGGKPAPVLNGYTGDQRFFLGWAQIWRRNYREADLRQRLMTDPHAPSIQRVWVMRNLDAWYDAYGVKPGDKLYLEPSKRVRVW